MLYSIKYESASKIPNILRISSVIHATQIMAVLLREQGIENVSVEGKLVVATTELAGEVFTSKTTVQIGALSHTQIAGRLKALGCNILDITIK